MNQGVRLCCEQTTLLRHDVIKIVISKRDGREKTSPAPALFKACQRLNLPHLTNTGALCEFIKLRDSAEKMSPANIPAVKLANGHDMPILGLGTWKVSLANKTEKLYFIVYCNILVC